MLMLMTNIVQFGYWNVQKKRKRNNGEKASHLYMYGPVYLLMVSMVLVMIQPVCMLIIGSWICDGQFTSDQLDPSTYTCNTTGCYNETSYVGKYLADGTFSDQSIVTEGTAAGDMWVSGCSPTMKNFFFDNSANPSALVPNTVVGWCIQIFGTYLGFILMFIGVCQSTMLHHKISAKWAAIRGN